MKINIVWFRRDLRLDDNTALTNALNTTFPVLILFVFDTNIINELPPDDPRISFIYERLESINNELKHLGSSVYVLKGDPIKLWTELLPTLDINAVYINKDYEPYAIQRDNNIEDLLKKNRIPLLRFKDQVIFEEGEITKSDNTPYTIFTPYKSKWLEKSSVTEPRNKNVSDSGKGYLQCNYEFPLIEETGFRQSSVKVKPYDLTSVKDYEKFRNFPYADKTSYLSPHLRFGTVSIRRIVEYALDTNNTFLSELIWREFFMQILFSYPRVVTENFKPKYDKIQWKNNEDDFKRWCLGETGYALVDAGMRQLNSTGYMHNRVRMITAGFLCKHLLIDWRWGEAYFAEKLLDYELSSNNGNWQWAAGTGCDAAPYFRIFNPETQQKKFDPTKDYVRKWVHDLDTPTYPRPMIEHDFARKRAIAAYKGYLAD